MKAWFEIHAKATAEPEILLFDDIGAWERSIN
jgi:hypothetical protein